jgi:CDP-glucose 4,6-dehydratase
VILISTTDKVYENTGSGIAFTENDSLRGKDPYSASKVAAENAVIAWREVLKEDSNKKILTARAGNVIGGGDFSENRLIPDIIRAFDSGSDLVIRNPLSTRPWQHVLDPLIGYLKMIDKSLKNSSFNTLNFGPVGKSLSVLEVVQFATKFWPSKSKINYVSFKEYSESSLLELNSSLASYELDWKPIWSQEAAVLESIAWWKDVLDRKMSASERCELDILKCLSNYKTEYNNLKN